MEQIRKNKSVFKYVPDTKYTYENIEQQKIYLPVGSELNDIYEMQPYFDIEHIWKIISKVKNSEELDVNDEVERTIKSNKILRDLIHKANFTSKKMIENYVTNILQVIYPKGIRVGSLTFNENSVIMWGLYAQNNKGLQIEYDYDSIKTNDVLFIDKINYLSVRNNSTLDFFVLLERKKVYESLDKLHRKSFQKNITTKYEKWSYEEEIRIFTYERTLESIDARINSITVGSKMDIKSIRKYYKLAAELKIPIYFSEIINEKEFHLKKTKLTHDYLEHLENENIIGFKY